MLDGAQSTRNNTKHKTKELYITFPNAKLMGGQHAISQNSCSLHLLGCPHGAHRRICKNHGIGALWLGMTCAVYSGAALAHAFTSRCEQARLPHQYGLSSRAGSEALSCWRARLPKSMLVPRSSLLLSRVYTKQAMLGTFLAQPDRAASAPFVWSPVSKPPAAENLQVASLFLHYVVLDREPTTCCVRGLQLLRLQSTQASMPKPCMTCCLATFLGFLMRRCRWS